MTAVDALAVVMCKAPVPGRVKTRLAPAVTSAQAARLHAAMAGETLGKMGAVFGAGWLAADDPAHPFFRAAAGAGWRIVAQGEGDLGARMARLAARAFASGHRAVVFSGTDSPHMPERRLHALRAALAEADVAIAPVADGGYELIGLRGNERALALFRGIAWSSGEVLTQTLAAARQAGLGVRLLPPGFDIDTPADLARARKAGWKPLLPVF